MITLKRVLIAAAILVVLLVAYALFQNVGVHSEVVYH